MPIQFPTSPTVGQQHYAGGQVWRWSGTVWQRVSKPAVNRINAQTTAYTLVRSDNGAIVAVNSATAVTLTVPSNSTVPFNIGTQVTVVNTGTGNVTVAGAAGVVINARFNDTVLDSRYTSAQLIKTNTDRWVMNELSAYDSSAPIPIPTPTPTPL